MEGEQGEGHRLPREHLAVQGPRRPPGSVVAPPFLLVAAIKQRICCSTYTPPLEIMY